MNIQMIKKNKLEKKCDINKKIYIKNITLKQMIKNY